MEEKGLAKKCTLGHIVFIGELYKKGLSERIMHECVIRSGADMARQTKSLECLTQLLTRVGKALDYGQDEQKLKQVNKYYKEIKDGDPSSNLSTRLRFLMKDLLELRANRWVPRHGRRRRRSRNPCASEAGRAGSRTACATARRRRPRQP